jgi:hypothetical protein
VDAFKYGLKPVPFRIFSFGGGFFGDLSSGLVEREIVGWASPVIFGPRIRISCTGDHPHQFMRLSLRKAA